MSDNRTDLPSPNAPNFQQRLRETIQTYLGRQGNPLDRGLTLRDLIDTGVLKIKSGFTLRPGGGSLPLEPGDGVVDVYEPDLTPPPTPTGFIATPSISHILIEHAAPLYTQGHGHLRTRLYGKTVNPGDPLPVFADAVEVAQFSGTIYAFPSNPATTWHLWIKWETVDGVLSAAPAGGTNGVVATTGQDVSSLLTALTGELTESQLYAGLTSRIDLIDGPASLTGSVAQRVAQEATNRANAISAEASTRAQAILDEAAARSSGDNALQTQIDLLSAAGSGDFSELLAAVQQEQTARIAGDAAEATARQTLAAQMRGDYTGTDPSALTTGLVYNERQARITAEGAISTNVSNLSAAVTNNYNTLNAAITTEQTARVNADTALSTQITSVSAVANAKNKTYYQTTAPTSGMVAGDIWFDSDDGNKAYRYSGSAWVATDDTRIAANAADIVTEQTARANADTALSNQITTLTSTVNGNTAAIQAEASTRASETGNLFGKYTVKVDLNGYVTGYGLASTVNNGTPTSEFTVVADKFSIAPVQTDNTANDGSPFFHRTTATTINGVSVPAGTYMKAAYIHDATITNAKIANLAVDNAKIADVSAGKLTAGSIAVGQYIQSAGYIAGSAGWRINGDGNAELSNAVVRGTVYATDGEFTGTVKAGTTILGASATSYSSGAGFYAGLDSAVYKWRVGNPTGARIQWTGTAIEVYNASNQLTISSGGISASYVSGLGAFATLDSITSANISTYIASAAIDTAYIADAAITQAKIGNAAITQAKIGNAAVGSAQIEDAAITTAKIGNAQVNTLQLAGQAVTIPVSSYIANTIYFWDGSGEVLSQSNTHIATGAPVSIIVSLRASPGSTADSQNGGFTTATGYFVRLKRNGQTIRNHNALGPFSGLITFALVDNPPAGTVTYSLYVGSTDAFASFQANAAHRTLITMETKR